MWCAENFTQHAKHAPLANANGKPQGQTTPDKSCISISMKTKDAIQYTL